MKVTDKVTMRGTDISKWQGDVDFAKMKRAGIEFVIIRAGYGKTEDKTFAANINGALAAGLLAGVYWFIYAKGSSDIKKNADKFHKVIEPYKDRITCGVWADWEYDSDRNAGTLTMKRRSEMVGEFCRIMAGYGHETGIYANQDYVRNKFTGALTASYPLWFARYNKTMGTSAYKGKDKLPYIWQYSSKGAGADYGASSQYIDLDYGYFETVIGSDNR